MPETTKMTWDVIFDRLFYLTMGAIILGLILTSDWLYADIKQLILLDIEAQCQTEGNFKAFRKKFDCVLSKEDK